MAFHPGTILVFDRAGALLGSLTGWSVSVPRSYAIGEIEDFAVILPLLNKDGSALVTPTLASTLLLEDNLIYVEDEIEGLPGWGGVIDTVKYANESVELRFLGGLSLTSGLQTDDRLSQTGGSASTMAQRLVSAANAKKAAHGDLQLGFVIDGTSPLYGTFDYEGDVYSGLSALATAVIGEFWAEWVLGPGATSLVCNIHWDRRIFVDHTDTTIADSDNGNLKSGSEFSSSGNGVVNRIRLRGQSTHLADFLDYDCIKSVVKDISPTVDVEIATLPNMRLREDLTLTVNFGLSDDMQKALATTGYTDPVTGDDIPGIQATYIGIYKTFLYAYHHWQGKPYLEGFDWSGPDGTNDKALMTDHFRTWNKLAIMPSTHTVITADSDGSLPDAVIDQWSLDTTINPLSGNAVGIALDWGTLSGHWIADGSTGNLVLLDEDLVTTTVWGNVGSTLLSVASDPGSINQIWVLLHTGGSYTIRSYDVDTKALLLEYTIPSTGSPTDIAVDYAADRLYVVGSGSTVLHIYDILSGSVFSPDPSFDIGGSANNIGISVSGGIAYALLTTGEVRMMFVKDGSFAGSFSTGITNAKAIYADFSNRRIWIVKSDGSIAIYHAYVAVGVPTDAGSVSGAPGFDELQSGTYLHIVLTSEGTHGPGSKSTPGTAATYTVRAPIGDNHDSLWKISQKFYGTGVLWPTIYRANKAIIGSNPSLIFPGQVFTIPNIHAAPPSKPKTRYFVAFTQGRWVQQTVPGPIGQPDQLQRVWDMDDQIVGFSHDPAAVVADPAVVIAGEEGRVCDWNPTLDGYGLLKTSQRWRTKSGHIVDTGHGWYPQQWDVPDRTFEPPQEPYWPEGIAFAQDYVNHVNRKWSVEQFTVTNKNGLWAKLARGGVYVLHASKQGPQPGGIMLNIRVLKFSPNDTTGEAELIAEMYVPDIPPP